MFKTKSIVFLSLFLLLTSFGFSAAALTQPQSTVSVEYEHRMIEGPNSIHIARFMPGEGRIVMAKAREYSLGRETVSTISARENAVFGMNAGFFEMRGPLAGSPTEVLKIRDKWYGVPDLPRAALGWKEDGTAFLLDRLKMDWKAVVGDREMTVDKVNSSRDADKLVLFTPAFNPTTLTEAVGLEVIVEDGRITAVRTEGDSAIPVNGLVLSFGPEAAGKAASPQPGTPVEVSYVFRPLNPEYAGDREWKEMDYLVGGAGMLVWNGEVVGDYLVEELEKQGRAFDTTLHPRTAVGIDGQGQWIFVVVDGRQPEKSVGISLQDLARLMASLGCRYAINFDGGGSSAMYLHGKILNSPSDRPGMERMMSGGPGAGGPGGGRQGMGGPGGSRPGGNRPGMERPAADGPGVERAVSDALLILE